MSIQKKGHPSLLKEYEEMKMSRCDDDDTFVFVMEGDSSMRPSAKEDIELQFSRRCDDAPSLPKYVHMYLDIELKM